MQTSLHHPDIRDYSILRIDVSASYRIARRDKIYNEDHKEEGEGRVFRLGTPSVRYSRCAVFRNTKKKWKERNKQIECVYMYMYMYI